jgi:hypothetical protein
VLSVSRCGRGFAVGLLVLVVAGCSHGSSPAAGGSSPGVSSPGTASVTPSLPGSRLPSATSTPGAPGGSGTAPGGTAPGGGAPGGSGHPPPTPLPTEPDGCVQIGTGTVVDAGTAGHPLPAVLLGGGLRAVVLVNDAGQQLCAWLPFARTLSRQGLRVVLYDPPAGDAVQALRTISTWLRDRGSTDVGYVGAGAGAATATKAATGAKPAPYAVVALSPAAATVKTAGLYAAAAAGDPAGTATARRLASGNHLRIVDGSARGAALVAAPGNLTSVLAAYLRQA